MEGLTLPRIPTLAEQIMQAVAQNATLQSQVVRASPPARDRVPFDKMVRGRLYAAMAPGVEYEMSDLYRLLPSVRHGTIRGAASFLTQEGLIRRVGRLGKSRYVKELPDAR